MYFMHHYNLLYDILRSSISIFCTKLRSFLNFKYIIFTTKRVWTQSNSQWPTFTLSYKYKSSNTLRTHWWSTSSKQTTFHPLIIFHNNVTTLYIQTVTGACNNRIVIVSIGQLSRNYTRSIYAGYKHTHDNFKLDCTGTAQWKCVNLVIPATKLNINIDISKRQSIRSNLYIALSTVFPQAILYGYVHLCSELTTVCKCNNMVDLDLDAT